MMQKSIKDHESEQISCRINTGFWFWTMIRLRKYLFSLEWPNRWKWNRFFAESSWQSGIEMVRYTGSQRWLKIESGRVPEWPMGTDCKSAAFQLRWFESTRAHQENACVEIHRRFSFANLKCFTCKGGFEQQRRRPRPTAKDSPRPGEDVSRRQKGEYREELLGQRSDFSRPRQGAAEKSANATRKAGNVYRYL